MGRIALFAYSEKGQTTEMSCWIAMVHPEGFATSASTRTAGRSDKGESPNCAGALPTSVPDFFCYHMGRERSVCDLPGFNLAAPRDQTRHVSRQPVKLSHLLNCPPPLLREMR
jgi:hypothetical protein